MSITNNAGSDGGFTYDHAITERDEWKARAERAEQFVRDHTMPSCTNPTCDCVEARLHRAERIVEAVRAVYEECVTHQGGKHIALIPAYMLEAALHKAEST